MEYIMSSTARLTSQLKGVQGCAEVSFIGATLQIPLSSNLESVRCSVVVNRQGTMLTRNSSACAFNENVQWNQIVTFPCCLDWDVEFSVQVLSNRNREVIATSDVMLVQSAGRLSLPLRVGAKCVGELDVSLIFHPNYRSFKYLAVGCYLSEQLSYSLTNSLLQDLRRNSNTTEGSMHALATEDDIMGIVAVIDNFTTFLTDEGTYHRELCIALNIPFEKDGCGAQDGVPSSRLNPLLHQRKLSTPPLVPLHRVASGAKNFLARLLGDLPQAPPVTIGLVEKILSIYTQALFVPDIRRSESSTHAPKAHTNAQSSSSQSELSLTWGQFAQLCIVSALWFLQQAAAAHELLGQCASLTLEELAALRFGFSQYDADLSATVSASDLHSLLQDMGEDYTEEELGLTSCYLDPDNLGVIDFADFVRWWCE